MLLVSLSLLFFICSPDADRHLAVGWSYEGDDGPKNWPQTCKGKQQSPINIDDSEVKINKNLRDIKFVNYDKALNNPTLVNNGHSVKLDIEDDSNVPNIQAGGLKSEYMFQQLHFHWGSEDSKGSEHTLNNKVYPMEMHLVHYNSNYEKDEVYKHEDGLAVLAVFIEVRLSVLYAGKARLTTTTTTPSQLSLKIWNLFLGTAHIIACPAMLFCRPCFQQIHHTTDTRVL
ncbi:carbonic anhydrase 2-like isoform X2 [Tachypleus tridentatus]|uniref:carbonic anhydrase 2-like isoform X2 n=1 Tax=Tachypleus tridentatus TaxID=6853 RepID=UPI003FD03558